MTKHVIYTGSGLDWAVVIVSLVFVVVATTVRLIINAINDHTRGLH